MNHNTLEFVKSAREAGYTWHDIAVVVDVSESKLKRLVGCKVKPTLPIKDWPPYLEYLNNISDPKPSISIPESLPILEKPQNIKKSTREDLINRLELVNSNKVDCESIDVFEALVDMSDDKLEVFRKYAGKNYLDHLPDNYARTDLLELLLEFCKENVIKYTGFPIQAKFVQKVEELEKILKTEVPKPETVNNLGASMLSTEELEFLFKKEFNTRDDALLASSLLLRLTEEYATDKEYEEIADVLIRKRMEFKL